MGYRDDCRLKIETEKTSEGTYAFIGTLLSDSFDPICTKGLSCLTSAIGEPWYAVPIISQNILLFFRSTLPQAFIKALFHGDITLSREEKDILVASPSFERLASTLASVEPLGIVPETLRPFLLFRLMIPDSFDRIECEGFFDYQGILVSSQDTRPLLRLMDGRWVRRSTEEEDAVTMGDTMVRDFIGSFDEMRDESILIKHTDDTIDGFFDRVDRMVADGHARFEYLQDTKRFVTTPVQVKVSVKSGIDWFDLSTEISVGDDVLAEGKNIVASIRKGKKFVLLSDGTALMLRESLKNTMDELEELGIDMANIHESQRIDRHMIGAFREQTKDISLVFDLDTKAKELKKAFENFSGIASVPLPIGLQATLREYQITGYHWLHFLYGYGFSGILADDMGLGKTIQTIAFLTKLYEDGAPKAPTLIVCPTSLLFNWVGEFQRFAPAMRVVSLASSKTDWNDIPGDTQVIVVSYTVLSLLTERLLDREFHVIVLDEAQNIKNSQAKRTKNLSLLRSHHRIALSGTPIENNLNELRSIFHFLMPGFLGSEKAFKDRYIGAEKEVLKRLSAKIRPFILRRTKEQVLKELPPKVEETIFLTMNDTQMKFYTTLKETYKKMVMKKIEEDGFQKSQFFVFEALMRLRQACLCPRLIADDKKTPSDSIKLTYLEENLEEIIDS